MEHRTHERAGASVHGMVTSSNQNAGARPRPEPARARPVAPLILILVMLALVGGITGGLVRAGVTLPPLFPLAGWAGHAAVTHGALMICGFMGTVIGMERAVAVKLRAAWLAPVSSGLGAICLLGNATAAATWLLAGAAVFFTAVNVVVVQRQRAAHTLLLLCGALAWLMGSVLFLRRPGDPASLPWWFAFLVMTIAAERLEMTRLMRRRPGSHWALGLLLGLMGIGATLTSLSVRVGGVLYGLSLLLLALWLGAFDIARRTVSAHGLARYMAVCLLGGYVWLAVAGWAWMGTTLGLPLRDTALHALGLGFIVSMMLGHAPVILPAVARIKVEFGLFFYVPLAALHLSLLVRLVWGFHDPRWRALGAALNTGAIALFAVTMVAAAVWWRVRHARADAQTCRQIR